MSKKIRLLKIISGFGIESPLGGIERFVISLSKELNKTQFEIIIFGLWQFCTPFEKKWGDFLLDHGIHPIVGDKFQQRNPYGSFIRSVKILRDHVKTYNPDIIHSHGKFCDLASLLSNLNKKTILARTVHDPIEWKKRPFRRILFTSLIYPIYFNIEIGVSQNITSKLNTRKLARLLDKKAVHINNAIDLSKFINFPIDLSSKRIELNIPEDTFVVGSIGRLTEQKGYCHLLSAAQIILNKISNVHFLLVGDGEDLSKLKLLSREFGISSNITFLGPRSDIVELLHIMDIFISSSLWEGLPSVVLESMAAGTPVIATDIPGSNELIRDQVNGLLVQPGNPKILADAITYLLNNDQKRKLYSNLSLEMVRLFSIETVTKQYEELYKTYFTS